MKKINNIFSIFLLSIFSFSLSSCEGLDDLLGTKENNEEEKIDNELESSTGKWTLKNDDDTYFVFDGSKDIMSYSYYEDGVNKYSGKYRVVYRGIGEDVLTPLTFIFKRNDKVKEDWIGCYVEDFKNDFTQFTVMQEEEDLGMTDGTIYTHIYRISELPYKLGSYILEGNEYKEETNNYKAKDSLYIPNGTYSLETKESFTFLMEKPRYSSLFQYKNNDLIIEGVYTVASDKKTIYLYIEHDPYTKVTNADKNKYDTTFSMDYPPDFYLRGDFSKSDSIVINDLYHHEYSPTEIKDSSFVFGTYIKEN